ncbi:hypothetical protein A483_HHAL012420 [Halyomorpha halys]|nr:hypothetical protein A483_HHAL012420 [Halyomorpha halys]
MVVGAFGDLASVGAFGDLASEISRCFRTESPNDKEKLKETIINETIPFLMSRLEIILKTNKGFLANGKLSWAEFYVVGFYPSIRGILGVDLTEKYPFFKELVERVQALPGIKEWVEKRPDTEV